MRTIKELEKERKLFVDNKEVTDKNLACFVGFARVDSALMQTKEILKMIENMDGEITKKGKLLHKDKLIGKLRGKN